MAETKRKRRKKRKNRLSQTDTKDLTINDFPKELVTTFLNCVATDWDDEDVHDLFVEEEKKYLKDKFEDKIEQGKLVVRLTRATIHTRPEKKSRQTCERHPKYKAMRKPRTDCKACWDMYNGKAKTEKAKNEKETTAKENS